MSSDSTHGNEEPPQEQLDKDFALKRAKWEQLFKVLCTQGVANRSPLGPQHFDRLYIFSNCFFFSVYTMKLITKTVNTDPSAHEMIHGKKITGWNGSRARQQDGWCHRDLNLVSPTPQTPPYSLLVMMKHISLYTGYVNDTFCCEVLAVLVLSSLSKIKVIWDLLCGAQVSSCSYLLSSW